MTASVWDCSLLLSGSSTVTPKGVKWQISSFIFQNSKSWKPCISHHAWYSVWTTWERQVRIFKIAVLGVQIKFKLQSEAAWRGWRGAPWVLLHICPLPEVTAWIAPPLPSTNPMARLRLGNSPGPGRWQPSWQGGRPTFSSSHSPNSAHRILPTSSSRAS